jgi:hypothetical protein
VEEVVTKLVGDSEPLPNKRVLSVDLDSIRMQEAVYLKRPPNDR